MLTLLSPHSSIHDMRRFLSWSPGHFFSTSCNQHQDQQDHHIISRRPRRTITTTVPDTLANNTAYTAADGFPAKTDKSQSYHYIAKDVDKKKKKKGSSEKLNVAGPNTHKPKDKYVTHQCAVETSDTMAQSVWV